MKHWLKHMDVWDHAGLAVMVVTVLISGTVFAVHQPTVRHDETRVDTPVAHLSPSPSVAAPVVASPSASPESSPTPATTTPPSVNAPAPSKSTQKSTPEQSPAPSSPAPFQIVYVRVDGASWYCAGGYALYATANSILNANNTAGGTFSWQVETSTPSALSTPISSAFPAGQGYYVGSPLDYKGPYFSGPVTAGESIRYKITGPNTIYSAWYTVPANASC